MKKTLFDLKNLRAEILTLLGTFLRLFEASNPYIYLKHFTQAFFDLERWNPHLTRNFSCINAKIYKYLKSLPYANNADDEINLQIVEILTLRELSGNLAEPSARTACWVSDF